MHDDDMAGTGLRPIDPWTPPPPPPPASGLRRPVAVAAVALVALLWAQGGLPDVLEPPSWWREGEATSYTFLRTEPTSGSPVRFSSCEPIHLVVNEATAPANADELLEEAIEMVTEASGLEFVVDGTTNEPPYVTRPPMNLARYGHHWSPVLVAWTDPQHVPRLGGNVLGLSAPRVAPTADPRNRRWVTGGVHLDGPQIDGLQRSAGDGAARAVVAHELAHLIGLGHVEDPTQIMNPEFSGRTRFGAGDLAGLEQLGAGPCFR